MSSYLSNRVLKLNVGFLLNDGPAHSKDSVLDIPAVRVADDLILDYIHGPLRLSRTKEGILVQAQLHAGVPDECHRCLDPVKRDINIDIEELFAYHSRVEAEFHIDDDAILDLGPLVRAEVLIDSSHRVLCSDGCKGLCPECGTNLNHNECDCDRDDIDPRFEVLKKLLNSNS